VLGFGKEPTPSHRKYKRDLRSKNFALFESLPARAQRRASNDDPQRLKIAEEFVSLKVKADPRVQRGGKARKGPRPPSRSGPRKPRKKSGWELDRPRFSFGPTDVARRPAGLAHCRPWFEGEKRRCVRRRSLKMLFRGRSKSDIGSRLLPYLTRGSFFVGKGFV